jgi:hypothetical protein
MLKTNQHIDTKIAVFRVSQFDSSPDEQGPPLVVLFRLFDKNQSGEITKTPGLSGNKIYSGWCFGTFFIFPYIRNI